MPYYHRNLFRPGDFVEPGPRYGKCNSHPGTANLALILLLVLTARILKIKAISKAVFFIWLGTPNWTGTKLT